MQPKQKLKKAVKRQGGNTYLIFALLLGFMIFKTIFLQENSLDFIRIQLCKIQCL